MPIRVQLSRRKGWRMPENTVKVAWPGPWGNAFKVGVHGTAEQCVALYRAVITEQDAPGLMTRDQLAAANAAWPDAFHCPCENTARIFLAGKNLACWCPLEQPCHADVLLELANAPPTDMKG